MHRGYLLPQRDAYTESLRWFLVAVPDRPEYVRAATGAYTDLTKWYVWERTGDTRGKQAADSFDLAVAETLRALEMGFPDQLLGYIDEVESLLSELRDCCSAGAGSQYTTPLPPELDPNRDSELDDSSTTDYGSTPVASASERLNYKCEAAYLFAGHVSETFAILGNYAEYDAPLTADQVGSIIGAIPGVTGWAAVAWALVDKLLDLAWADATGFEGASQALADEVDTIACAIYQADGPEAVAAALKSAVKDALTGYTFATFIAEYLPYLMWANVIYEGEFVNDEGELVDISSILTPGAHTCCQDSPLFAFDWEDGTFQGWSGPSEGTRVFVENGFLKARPANTSSWMNWTSEDAAGLASRFQLTLPIVYNRVRATYKYVDQDCGSSEHLWHINYDTGLGQSFEEFRSSSEIGYDTVVVDEKLPGTITLDGTNAIQIGFYRTASCVAWLYLDKLEFFLD